MSALRLGRLPDGTRDVRPIDDGAVGRLSHSRFAIRGGIANPIYAVPVSQGVPNVIPVSATTHERRAQMAAYKASKKQ